MYNCLQIHTLAVAHGKTRKQSNKESKQQQKRVTHQTRERALAPKFESTKFIQK